MQLICESLPISSSGHVQLMWSFWYWATEAVSQDSYEFIVSWAIESCSLPVIIYYFFKRWWYLIFDKPISCLHLFDWAIWQKHIFPVLIFGLCTELVTGIMFIFFSYSMVDEIPYALGFLITALILWSSRFAVEKKEQNIWALDSACWLGLAQGFAIIPGVSRFASTISMLQWLGYERTTAFAISFLVHTPILIIYAIGVISSFFVMNFYSIPDSNIVRLIDLVEINFLSVALLGMILSFYILKFVGHLIEKKQLWKISYYMIVPIIGAFFM